MPEVFISYARANESAAKRVESGLQAAGFNAWRDDQLPAHRAYSDIIQQRLRDAAAVVVLWSKDAAQSQWVRAEADFARTERKLVQAQLDDTLPPLPFNQVQCADLRGWRGHRSHKGWVKLTDSVVSVIAGERPPAAGETRRAPLQFDPHLTLGAFALLVLTAAAILLLLPRLTDGPEEKPRLAVLPFESVGSSNEALVAGMWEDTRQAISRNPQLLVLGPNTAEEIERKSSGGARKAADYLLQASVRTEGERVRVSASLVRLKDEAQIWSDTFDRKLDDVFALQTEIAQQIEGQIRGRLARGGGVLPEHITTSGEVYLLYSEARAAISKRDARSYVTAHRQLKQAVKADPNFAPAWATLSVAEYIARPRLLNGTSSGREAELYARRAIRLAPNLAAGHAALAQALGLSGPAAEAALRRAVALNPNDVEILNLLAILESSRGRREEALGLYTRALTIEPLWWPAVLNRLALWFDTNRQAAVDKELARLDSLGDLRLASFAHMAASEWRGDLSEAVRIGLAYYHRAQPSERSGVDDYLSSLLLRLGHDAVAWKLSNAPPNAPLMWRNDPKGLEMFEARNLPLAAFWKIPILSEVVSRTYLTMGREAKLLQMYKGVVGSPDEFLNEVNHPLRFLHMAPIVAVAFQRTGEPAEAVHLLAGADTILEQSSTNGLNLREQAIYTARVRAVQGRHGEAVAALRKALNRGWSPPAPWFKPDLQDDPALALLREVQEFQQIRARVLAHLAKERAELGPVELEPVRLPPTAQ